MLVRGGLCITMRRRSLHVTRSLSGIRRRWALKQAGVEHDRVGGGAKHHGRAEQVLDLVRTCGTVGFDFNAGRRPVGTKIAAHGLDHWVDDVLGVVSAPEADRLERAKSPAGQTVRKLRG